MMSFDSARSFRAAYEGAVKRYSRMTKAGLVAEERALMADQGIERVHGGPRSKNELVRSVLDLRGYTVTALNESTHVLYHVPGERWSACELCQCQETWIAPSDMVPGCDQLLQCVLDPGHRGFCRDDQAREHKRPGTGRPVKS